MLAPRNNLRGDIEVARRSGLPKDGEATATARARASDSAARAERMRSSCSRSSASPARRINSIRFCSSRTRRSSGLMVADGGRRAGEARRALFGRSVLSRSAAPSLAAAAGESWGSVAELDRADAGTDELARADAGTDELASVLTALRIARSSRRRWKRSRW